METKLSRIAEVARTRPNERMTNVMHVLDKQMLWDCHLELEANKAAGVDGVSKAKYEEKLEANLDDLVGRMKRQAYKPQASRRTYIPKDEKSVRPLGIPAYEDKIVQRAMAKVLNAIYEPKFLGSSYGFRPGRNQHQALRELDTIIMRQPTRYIVDADIRGFFNHVDHEWMMRMLEQDIGDPNFLRLIRRFLKAGIIEEGEYEATEEGTPQGGLISPILANVYLHYVVDLWFEKQVKTSSRGEVGMVRYADDFVCGFEEEGDARRFYAELVERMKKFNLSIAEEKTKIIRFGRGAEVECKQVGLAKPETFDFLGFKHIWGKGKNGKYRLKRKTSAKKFRMRLKEMNAWIRRNRHRGEKELVEEVNRKLQGHYAYYGVSDNYDGIAAYYQAVMKLIQKWRNRRSQRRSFSWEKFRLFKRSEQVARPRIKVNLFRSQSLATR